jgi:hypothetical protein
MSFGVFIEGKKFRVVDERVMRLNALFILLLAATAFINGFELKNYAALPFIIGVIWLNFIIGIFINLDYSITVAMAKLILGKEIKKPIGAIQKKFAWSLGLVLSSIILVLSSMLPYYPGLFNTVCVLCLICIAIIFLEAAFKICLGCELYFLAIKLKFLKEPKPDERPNCMGDSCEVKTEE